MELRTARRGQNAGGQFWGCSKYPECKGTLPFENGNDRPAPQNNAPQAEVTNITLPIVWADSIRRDGWISEYVTVGSIPFSVSRNQLEIDTTLNRTLSQCNLLSSRTLPRRNQNQAQLMVANIILKILRRGSNALTTPDIEYAALKEHGLKDHVNDLSIEGQEYGFEWSNPGQKNFSPESYLTHYFNNTAFNPDSSLTSLFDSPVEALFYNEWLPNNCIADPRHWLSPQASLDGLLSAINPESTGGRRVDFLFSHPLCEPLVIELDGDEHQDRINIDGERDQQLESLGIKVVRIQNSDVEEGNSQNLDTVKTHINKALVANESLNSSPDPVTALVESCTWGTKLQYAITRSIQQGIFPENGVWNILIEGGDSVSREAVIECAKFVLWLDQIYSTSVAPAKIVLSDHKGEQYVYIQHELSFTPGGETPTNLAKPLHIKLDRNNGAFAEITSSLDSSPDLVIRPAFLPIDIAVSEHYQAKRASTKHLDSSNLKQPLQSFLRTIFRKREFREGQLDAVHNALRGVDSVILLPTGAGKSIIYQLSGLLLPGITIVIDPLVSLIEDQVDGLKQYGITRAIGVSAHTLAGKQRSLILSAIERSEYQFLLLSPERLQSPEFRNTLTSLAQGSIINLAVIDEAHCVSEWGHDFRPSYLHLGRNLRQFCKDNSGLPPPLLALTGTASRAVLRDLLADLNISTDDSSALIRPASFDRHELSFEIRRTKPGGTQAVLKGIINTIFNDFGLPREEFFAPSGRYTNSGIIFTKFVNGVDGVGKVSQTVSQLVSSDVVLFSGKTPQGFRKESWEHNKRDFARRFKTNKAPILVATKAFGMGIDKPNIRYTIHYGMPSSLEAFYQEAGRAGRDRKDAICYIVFNEYDADFTDQLLDPSKDIESIRNRLKEVHRSSRDDASNSLWFHLNSFKGIATEIDAMSELLDLILPIEHPAVKEIPFPVRGDRTLREKAIFRLLQCGVITDYEVDFGSKKFVLHLNQFDKEKITQSILDYISASQPGRVSDIALRLSSASTTDQKSTILDVVRTFIEFIYDVIERSRRRSLQESIHAAREAEGNTAFRKRLLEYLQEGVDAESIQELLDKTLVDFADWLIYVERMNNAVEAGEIRGMAIRFLESYPDHPGLLLLRGLVECMTSDSDTVIIAQSILGACEMGVQRYTISNEQVDDLMDQLQMIARNKLKKLAEALGYVEFKLYLENNTDLPGLERLKEMARTDKTSAKIYKYQMTQLMTLKASRLLEQQSTKYM